MPLLIKKITISNFRGISLPLELNFYKSNKANSVLVMGRNGSGKSSIVDALEWFHRQSIHHLSREGITTSDYPHKLCGGNDCYIEMEFTDPSIKTAKLSFNAGKVTTSLTSGQYNEFTGGGYANHPFYLRYRDLQDFVYKTKKEKYTYLAHFFGLKEYTALQDGLQLTITRYAQQIHPENHRKIECQQKLVAVLGTTVSISERPIIQMINRWLQKHQLPPITAFNEIKTALASIKLKVDNNPKAKEQMQWQTALDSLRDLQSCRFQKTEAALLEKLFARLKESERSITRLFLSQLYEKGLQILPKLEEPNVCPFCDKEFKGDLSDHVKTKHEKLQDIIALKNEFDALVRSLKAQCASINQKLSLLFTITDVPERSILLPLQQVAEKMRISCTPITDTLNGDILMQSALDLSSCSLFEEVNDFNTQLQTVLQKIEAKIEELKKDAQGSPLVELHTGIRELGLNYRQYLISSEKAAHLEVSRHQCETLLEQLTVNIAFHIQNIFSTISADVITYFNVLEDNHQFLKNPNLVLVTGKNKAVELSIEFSGENVMPAYKYLSESQVNSFGVAIFLASVKQFNPQFKFIVLDDVVNSFDIHKRPRLIQVISTHFKDYQFLALTHDDIFFERMSKAFTAWHRIKFTGWDFRNGPSYQLGLNFVERIEAAIKNDEPGIAGQQLGQYLEWIFNVLCESWKVKTEHKQDNQYTLSELFDPLKAKMLKEVKKDKLSHQLERLLNAFDNPSGFRNFCVHYKNPATNYTCSELGDILKKWKEIEALLYCQTSKSYVSYKKTGSVESLMCACGTLNLKLDGWYQPI